MIHITVLWRFAGFSWRAREIGCYSIIQKQKFVSLLGKHLHMFSYKPGLTKEYDHSIKLVNDEQCFVKPYPILVNHRKAVEQDISSLDARRLNSVMYHHGKIYVFRRSDIHIGRFLSGREIVNAHVFSMVLNHSNSGCCLLESRQPFRLSQEQWICF